MLKNRHTTTVATRPAYAASGSYGWFKNGDISAGVQGTIVTADFLNDVQDELTNLISTATGGGLALSSSTTQVRDSILAMITKAKTSVYVFVPAGSTNASTQLSTRNITPPAGTATTTDIVTVNLGVPPTYTGSGIPRAIVRFYVNANTGGNAACTLSVRKNTSETFALKETFDPTGLTTITIPAGVISAGSNAYSIDGRAAFETESQISIPVIYDTATHTFDYQFVHNYTNQSVLASNFTVTIWLDGWYLPMLV